MNERVPDLLASRYLPEVKSLKVRPAECLMFFGLFEFEGEEGGERGGKVKDKRVEYLSGRHCGCEKKGAQTRPSAMLESRAQKRERLDTPKHTGTPSNS